jgi:hypothetical protein
LSACGTRIGTSIAPLGGARRIRRRCCAVGSRGTRARCPIGGVGPAPGGASSRIGRDSPARVVTRQRCEQDPRLSATWRRSLPSGNPSGCGTFRNCEITRTWLHIVSLGAAYVLVNAADPTRDRENRVGDRQSRSSSLSSVSMTSQPIEPKRDACLELPVDKLLRRARPLPPHEEMVIDGLTEDEGAAFLAAFGD